MVLLIFSFSLKQLSVCCLLLHSTVLLEHVFRVPVDDLMGREDVLLLCMPHCAKGTEDLLLWKSEHIIPKDSQESSDRNDNFANHIFSYLRLTGLKKNYLLSVLEGYIPKVTQPKSYHCCSPCSTLCSVQSCSSPPGLPPFYCLAASLTWNACILNPALLQSPAQVPAPPGSLL